MHGIIPVHTGMLWKKNTQGFTFRFSLLLLFRLIVETSEIGIPKDLTHVLLPLTPSTPILQWKEKEFAATMMKCPWTSKLSV